MARPEDTHEETMICIKKLLESVKATWKCQCPMCRGRTKPGRPKEPEFPELIPKEEK